MSGYTKLFSSIIASTVWRTDNGTRIVWITMLAMADRNGIVEGSVPGLADLARVPVETCRRALKALESPDKDSRSKAHEGRRILTIDGGWQLVNHAKYRAKMNADDRREYLRQKQAEFRSRQHQRKQTSTTVNIGQPPSTRSTHTDPSPDPDPSPKAEDQTLSTVRASRSLAVPDDFARFWALYPKKKGKGAALKAWMKAKPPIEVIVSALEWQVSQPDWVRDAGQYIPHPATWLNGRRWEDEPFHPVAEPPAYRPGSSRTADTIEAGRRSLQRALEKIAREG